MINIFRLPERARHVLGVNARNLRLIRPYNRRSHFPLADDKILTKELLDTAGVPVPRTLAVFSSLVEASHAAESLQSYDDLVIKPARGRGGGGILVLVERHAGGWLDHAGRLHGPRDVDRHVGNIIFGNHAHGLSDRALVEERVCQATLIGSRPMPGLPDIRVITLRGVALLAMLRLPTARSRGRANLHQGAIGVGVDLETGRTTHATLFGESIERHPDTETALTGGVITRWPDVLDIASRAARALPLGYLGMDVAIDAHRGPLVLEANVRPGLEIQNANRMGLRRIAEMLHDGLGS